MVRRSLTTAAIALSLSACGAPLANTSGHLGGPAARQVLQEVQPGQQPGQPQAAPQQGAPQQGAPQGAPQQGAQQGVPSVSDLVKAGVIPKTITKDNADAGIDQGGTGQTGPNEQQNQGQNGQPQGGLTPSAIDYQILRAGGGMGRMGGGMGHMGGGMGRMGGGMGHMGHAGGPGGNRGFRPGGGGGPGRPGFRPGGGPGRPGFKPGGGGGPGRPGFRPGHPGNRPGGERYGRGRFFGHRDRFERGSFNRFNQFGRYRPWWRHHWWNNHFWYNNYWYTPYWYGSYYYLPVMYNDVVYVVQYCVDSATGQYVACEVLPQTAAPGF